METLELLLPSPIQWDRNGVKGELFVLGDLKNNRLKFSFEFLEEQKSYPLVVEYSGENQELMRCPLTLMSNKECQVDSYIFNPPVSIQDGIFIKNIFFVVNC